MSLSYTLKRLARSWQLYIALLLGVILAATFFAGINVGADTAAKQALDRALSQVPVDIVVPTIGFQNSGVISSKNVTDIMQRISTVENVEGHEAQSYFNSYEILRDFNLTNPARILGMTENSRVYDGWIGGKPTLEENEVYVLTSSPDASKFKVGDPLSGNLTLISYDPEIGREVLHTLPWNFRVAGFAQLKDSALDVIYRPYGYSYLSPMGGGVIVSDFGSYRPSENLLLADWERTLTPILDAAYAYSPLYSPITTDILVYLNRGGLVFPWDIGGSVSRVNNVADRITEKTSAFGLQPNNFLGQILSNFQYTAFSMRFLFISFSLPVFFVAWYMGSTVSDVSFNLRRREIGLLLTKGFSKRQLLVIFLTEALLLGLLGGFIGMGLGIALNPIFVRAAGGEFTGPPYTSWDTVLLTVTFAVGITFLSTFQSARRASNLSTINALREYVYLEESKPYKRTWPWLAFSLGAYKMVILLFGINVFLEMQKIAQGGSMLLTILAGLLFILDMMLTFIGPWLFVWGVAKLLIRGSLKFQELAARAFKFLGELGALATKNVQRNPTRSAAVAFLIALIIAYSFQVTGSLASQQDLNTRNTLFDVGADVSVTLGVARPSFGSSQEYNATFIENEIKKNLSDSIASTTVEYSLWERLALYSIQLKAIDPDSWLDTAYYESDWFSGRDVQVAFNLLKQNNDTIVLERGYGTVFDKKLDEYVTMSMDGAIKDLKIVGFFGYEPPTAGTSSGQATPSSISFRTYWSFIPVNLLKSLSSDFLSSQARILIKLKEGASGKTCADRIRGLGLDFSGVYSVEEQLTEQQSDIMVAGPLNVLRVGVIFIILASSVGTALVTLVSLKERERETSIMSVRGLSGKQLIVMLLAENLAIVTFAVVLGTAVGLLIVRGTVASTNAGGFSLMAMRMVFPPDVALTLLSAFVLIFASTILPVMFMARRFSSRLDRIVRQA